MIRRVSKNGAVIEYELKQTQRKNIECRVTPNRVTVFAPFRLPVHEADAFVLKQADWILNALNQSKANAEAILERNKKNMQDGMPIPIEGKNYLLLCREEGPDDVQIDGNRIIVSGMEGNPLITRVIIREYLQNLAMKRLEERVRYHAERIGVHPKSITLREQKTKWGSCSSLGNLNFNWKLIMAPPEALDYVVVHELCHMLEMNHSPAFWAQVEKHCPDYKKWQDHLKNGISSPFE